MADAIDFNRLADWVLAERRRRDLGRRDLAERMGVSGKTVARIEQGKSISKTTFADVERALDWKPGSVRSILAGGEPTPISESEADAGLYVQELRDEVEEEMMAVRGQPEDIRWAFIFERRERLAAEEAKSLRQGKQLGQSG